MIRSCYTDQFNLRQPYKVGILTVPTFQMRISEAPSMRRAGPRSHSEEVKESVRSVCLQHRCTKHWASIAPIPTATPQVSTSTPLEQVYYSHRERTPRTQGHENEASPPQEQETQDHLAAMETGGTVSTGLPSPAITVKDHVFQLSVAGIKYSSWPNRKCTQRQKVATAKLVRSQEKKKCSSQCKKDPVFCFVLFF